MKYAEILLPKQIGPKITTLTYKIPSTEEYSIGEIVQIPLRNKKEKGVITSIHTNKPKYQTKEIIQKVKNAPPLAKWQLELMQWIASYYFTPLSKALKLFLPTAFIKKKKIKELQQKEEKLFELKFKHTLNKEQKEALKKIKTTNKKVCLLHGITGSGKTEIYMHTIEECIKANQQVLVLIPEISLTPQTEQRFKSHFNEETVVIHSKLTPKQKEEAWKKIYKNKAKIIIGSRSSLFAPFQSLSHIIIDEEHDSSYKQDQSPRYNAKNKKKKITDLIDVKIIMGSATPSLTSYFNALNNQYELIELSSRPTKDNLSLPKAKIVDLRQELKAKNFSIFSEILQQKIQEKLNKKEQILLFLNRRGAASAVICRMCGFIVKCPNCEIPMTYHKKITVENSVYPTQKLICHHCGLIKNVPTACPQCSSPYIKFIGTGTQKVEEEINKMFPNARVIRADKDTTQKKDQFKRIYETFKKGEADILIGTQMIAMGLHLPKINLVGVILADSGLTIPNFSSSEKTFQIITQVAGRAGRESQGEVIIQTYLPNNYAIQAAANHDYKTFYEKEIILRKELKQPPFTKLIKLTIKDSNNTKAERLTEKLFNQIKNKDKNNEYQINYYPALIAKLNNQYRWHILLNGPSPQDILPENIKTQEIAIDVDPESTV